MDSGLNIVHKRIAVLITGVIALGLAILAWNWLIQPAQSTVSGSLKDVRNAVMHYKERQILSYSPACGCMDIKPSRGIGFVATNISVQSRMEEESPASYVIVSPYPAVAYPFPAITFDAIIVKFVVSDDSCSQFAGSLDNSLVMAKSIPTRGAISRMERRNLSFLRIRPSNGDIAIHQYGRVPFGAWLPTSGSLLSLSRDKKKETMSIEESIKRHAFVHYQWGEAGSPRFSQVELPILDLLGVPIAVWTDREADIWMNDEENALKPVKLSLPVTKNLRKLKQNERLRTAIFIYPKFSARIVTIPSGKSPLDAEIGTFLDYLSEETFGRASENFRSPSFLLTVNFDADQEEALKIARAAVDKDKITQVKDIGAVKHIYRDYGRISDHLGFVFPPPWRDFPFEYPNLPEKVGFTPYGLIDYMILPDIKGDLTFDALTVSFGAPSVASFFGIKSLEPIGSSMTFLADDALEFRATVEGASLGREYIFTNLDKYRRELNIVGLLVAFSFAVPLMYRLQRLGFKWR